ncbi:hypothetical protein Cgig2_027407 [Carnegiea gigantea]|uniref:Uncharacterized protein n=1 Tax=Carnegiea gigantea TaxID=171969 RepID=A0A9Q1Q7K3_9CARY|nr:hypothetical protein Cgig2_027407 [Carnegiea gigantea]
MVLNVLNVRLEVAFPIPKIILHGPHAHASNPATRPWLSSHFLEWSRPLSCQRPLPADATAWSYCPSRPPFLFLAFPSGACTWSPIPPTCGASSGDRQSAPQSRALELSRQRRSHGLQPPSNGLGEEKTTKKKGIERRNLTLAMVICSSVTLVGSALEDQPLRSPRPKLPYSQRLPLLDAGRPAGSHESPLERETALLLQKLPALEASFARTVPWPSSPWEGMSRPS